MDSVNFNAPEPPIQPNQPTHEEEKASGESDTSQTGSLNREEYRSEINRILEEASTDPDKAIQDIAALLKRLKDDFNKA
jgi:hypothetical protein